MNTNLTPWKRTELEKLKVLISQLINYPQFLDNDYEWLCAKIRRWLPFRVS